MTSDSFRRRYRPPTTCHPHGTSLGNADNGACAKAYGNGKDKTIFAVETALKDGNQGAVGDSGMTELSTAIRGPLCQGLRRADHTHGSPPGEIRTDTMRLLLETWNGIMVKPRAPHASYH